MLVVVSISVAIIVIAIVRVLLVAVVFLLLSKIIVIVTLIVTPTMMFLIVIMEILATTLLPALIIALILRLVEVLVVAALIVISTTIKPFIKIISYVVCVLGISTRVSISTVLCLLVLLEKEIALTSMLNVLISAGSLENLVDLISMGLIIVCEARVLSVSLHIFLLDFISIVVIVTSLFFELLVLFVFVTSLALLGHFATLMLKVRLLGFLELPVHRIVPLVVIRIEKIVVEVIVENHVFDDYIRFNLLTVDADKMIVAMTCVTLRLIISASDVIDKLVWMN